MISDMETGEMNTEQAIRFSLINYLNDLPQQPGWSDGSGLTRYNLVTPHSLVVLLEKLVQEYGEERILELFPAGGVSGTIRGLYRSPEGEPPYVFAKTGTLRNNTALSGYVYTLSGKRLNFSIINNNYVISNNALRMEMGRLLELIRDNF
jgi:serine-type D-Ala-D-Ala carboxypeptidase/endopeptidase (penicillin-binding protein 4)